MDKMKADNKKMFSEMATKVKKIKEELKKKDDKLKSLMGSSSA